MRITDDHGSRLLVGMSPAEVEGYKGYHGSHVLVIVDEAIAMSHEEAAGLDTLMASGDARMLLLLNPTDTNSWASEAVEAGGYNVITIPAWDTPNFSCMSNDEIHDRWGVELPATRRPLVETSPKGADLISPKYCDDLLAAGNGPGSFQWETSVEARFFEQGSDVVVPKAWYDLSRSADGVDGPVNFGVDLASYGDSESVVAIRKGNRLIALHAVTGVRTDRFWHDYVKPLVESYEPVHVCFDADGPGAGSYSDAAAVCGERRMLPFRGSYPMSTQWVNYRSMGWWNLRRRFELADIAIGIDDPVLRRQMTTVTYRRRNGLVAVTSKADLRRREGLRHLDRADAVVYAFATDPPSEQRRAAPSPMESLDTGEQRFWSELEREVRRKAPLPRSRRRRPVVGYR
jgi:hypothetical protein